MLAKQSTHPLWQFFEHRISFVVCLLFGLARAWIGRYSLDSDGISYLDLSDAFNRHDWHSFLSAYWSPLYPFLLAISRLILPTSKHWELPSAHILNFAIFAAALVSFEFFYTSLRESLITKSSAEDDTVTLIGERPLWFLAHALFLWASLDLITIWGIGTDLLVSAFVYVIAGIIMRFGNQASWKSAAAFGAVLGVSYWAKAVMFPLAFPFMLIALLRAPNVRTAVARALITLVTFSALAGPLVAALSREKHRLTFGDSGRIAYAEFVSPGGVLRNWQGEPAWGLTAVHPTRRVLDDPPVYEFAQPVGGTFPPFYDPSYWQEGLVPRFQLRPQLKIAAQHLLFYADLLLHHENALLAALLTFVAIAGKGTGRSLRKTWLLLFMSAAAFGLYMLVHAETRFLGGYIAVLWLALLSPLQVPKELRRMSNLLLLAVAAVLLLTVADNTARAIREGGPYSAIPDIQLSDRIDSLGVHPGDRIGIIGDVGIYAVRLSHAKIVAEIMPADAFTFWRLSSDKKGIVFQKFGLSGAEFILAADPGPTIVPDASWLKINGQRFYVHALSRAQPSTFGTNLRVQNFGKD